MIPCSVYKVSDAELRRNPPEFRIQQTTQASVVALARAVTVFEPSPDRHFLCTSLSFIADFTAGAAQTLYFNRFDLRLFTTSDNEIGEVVSLRAGGGPNFALNTAQGAAATAQPGLAGTFTFNSNFSFWIPAQMRLRLASILVSSDAAAPVAHSLRCTVVGIATPQGDVVR